MKVENSAGREATPGSSRQEMMPGAVLRAQQLLGVEGGLAEEDVGPGGLEGGEAAQDHARGRGRDPADALELALALVRGEELDQGAQVLEVQQGEALGVRVVEDQPQRGLLGGVQLEHFRHQHGPEVADGGADRHPLPLPAKGEELRRRGAGDPLLAAGRGARRELLGGLAGHGDAGEIALHVGDEHRRSRVRGLLGDDLQGAGLAGAGGAGDEAVTVQHRHREIHRHARIGLLPVEHRAEVDATSLEGVRGAHGVRLCGARGRRGGRVRFALGRGRVLRLGGGGLLLRTGHRGLLAGVPARSSADGPIVAGRGGSPVTVWG
jgi:hypothetical protein